MDGHQILATVIRHYRDLDDPSGPIFYVIDTGDGNIIDQVASECLHAFSSAPKPKQSQAPSLSKQLPREKRDRS